MSIGLRIQRRLLFVSVFRNRRLIKLSKTIHHTTFLGMDFSVLYLAIRVRWSNWICKVGSEMSVAGESEQGRAARRS